MWRRTRLTSGLPVLAEDLAQIAGRPSIGVCTLMFSYLDPVVRDRATGPVRRTRRHSETGMEGVEVRHEVG